MLRDKTSFRIAIPLKIVEKLGWESCTHVKITFFGERQLLIGRCENAEGNKEG